MNKFNVLSCSKQINKEGYNGYVVALSCLSNNGLVLFFPVSEENASLITLILEKTFQKKNININNMGNIIGVYKTMIDSWEAGNRFLSGILMDAEYDTSGELIIVSRLIVSDENGKIDSIVKVNFIHSILLAAVKQIEILITDEILNKLLPDDEELEELEELEKDKLNENSEKFPVDKDIIEIAKKILGKNK